jgi:hypothetical protein
MKSRSLWIQREEEMNSEHNIAQSSLRIYRRFVVFKPIPYSVLDQTFFPACMRIYNMLCSIAR